MQHLQISLPGYYIVWDSHNLMQNGSWLIASLYDFNGDTWELINEKEDIAVGIKGFFNTIEEMEIEFSKYKWLNSFEFGRMLIDARRK